MSRTRLLAIALAGPACLMMSALPARAAGSDPTSDDPLGPLTDVTAHWRSYQPASDFCVLPAVYELPTSPETGTGMDPACTRSGFAPSAVGLYEVKITAPPLCEGCRRLFIDYSRITPGTAAAPTAHGHAYFRLMSLNASYTVSPIAHSPNIKNLTNDFLVAPPGSPSSSVAAAADHFDMASTGDTANFAHIAAQGPYYVGPWYLNADGSRIHGAYLDVDRTNATQLPDAEANVIRYAAGFDASPATCPDAALFGAAYTDGNYFYGGCVNAFGGSSPPGVDPWADD